MNPTVIRARAAVEEKVIAFMADFQAHDLDRLQAWFGEDSVVWAPPAGPVRGARRIKALFRAIFGRYREIRWTIERIYPVDERTVVYEHSSQGTLRRGTLYANRAVTILEFDANGKIARLSDFFKDTRTFSYGKMT